MGLGPTHEEWRAEHTQMMIDWQLAALPRETNPI